jgi:ABC-type glycerol-3-phosphate transport system substrate-binding protein
MCFTNIIKEEMMKRFLVFFLLVIIAGALFAEGKQESKTESGVTNLSLVTQNLNEPDRKDTFLEMMDMFSTEYPNIDVELIGISYSEIPQQVQIMVSGGNAPDMVMWDANYSIPFVSMGAVADIKSYFTEEELADIPAGVLSDCFMDDGLYLIPLNLGTIAVFGWKSLLQNAGLPLEIPDTWSDFKTATEKITDTDAGIYGFGARTSRTQNSAMWFLPVMWGHGGNLVDDEGNIIFDNPGTVDALEWYREIGTTDQVPVGMGVREGRNVFGQGKMGFVFDGPWLQSILRSVTEQGEAIDDEYVVGVFPKAVNGDRYGIHNGPAMSIMTQCEDPDQAIKLVKFLYGNKEATELYFEKNKFAPVSKELLSDPMYDDPFLQPFIESLEFSRAYASSKPQYHTALEFIAIAMQEALLGGDPKKAAETADRNIKAIYGQLK